VPIEFYQWQRKKVNIEDPWKRRSLRTMVIVPIED